MVAAVGEAELAEGAADDGATEVEAETTAPGRQDPSSLPPTVIWVAV